MLEVTNAASSQVLRSALGLSVRAQRLDERGWLRLDKLTGGDYRTVTLDTGFTRAVAADSRSTGRGYLVADITRAHPSPTPTQLLVGLVDTTTADPDELAQALSRMSAHRPRRASAGALLVRTPDTVTWCAVPDTTHTLTDRLRDAQRERPLRRWLNDQVAGEIAAGWQVHIVVVGPALVERLAAEDDQMTAWHATREVAAAQPVMGAPVFFPSGPHMAAVLPERACGDEVMFSLRKGGDTTARSFLSLDANHNHGGPITPAMRALYTAMRAEGLSATEAVHVVADLK